MEADERPTKVRKLSHSENNVPEDLPSPSGAQNPPRIEQDSSDSVEQVICPETNTEAESHEEEGPGQLDESKDHPSHQDEPDPATSVTNDQEQPQLSKNQLKKLRKKAEWEAGREERKLIRKEKLVAKRERKRAAKQDQPEKAPPTDESAKQTRQKAVQLPVTIVIDCDFDDLMRDNERISLAGQVTRSYSDNKNSLFRAHLTFCSFGGKLRERFDTILGENYKSWRGVRALDSDFVETAQKAKEWMASEGGGVLAGVFSKYTDLDEAALSTLKEQGEVVYLTSEGDEDLTELKPYSTYIIGGLVDKNREKGICYKRASKQGVRTARLPIGEYMAMQSRKVLATNHVNEIMLKWLECGDWGAAFMKAIPKRKGGTLKGLEDEENEEQSTDGGPLEEAANPSLEA